MESQVKNSSEPGHKDLETFNILIHGTKNPDLSQGRFRRKRLKEVSCFYPCMRDGGE
jgi:hypothetical protein